MADEQQVELQVGSLGASSIRRPQPGDAIVCPVCGQEHNLVEWRGGGNNRGPELWVECAELAKRQGLARPFVRAGYQTSSGSWRLISSYELVKSGKQGPRSGLPGSGPG